MKLEKVLKILSYISHMSFYASNRYSGLKEGFTNASYAALPSYRYKNSVSYIRILKGFISKRNRESLVINLYDILKDAEILEEYACRLNCRVISLDTYLLISVYECFPNKPQTFEGKYGRYVVKGGNLLIYKYEEI